MKTVQQEGLLTSIAEVGEHVVHGMTDLQVGIGLDISCNKVAICNSIFRFATLVLEPVAEDLQLCILRPHFNYSLLIVISNR